jgi:hypothetical protein
MPVASAMAVFVFRDIQYITYNTINYQQKEATDFLALTPYSLLDKYENQYL